MRSVLKEEIINETPDIKLNSQRKITLPSQAKLGFVPPPGTPISPIRQQVIRPPVRLEQVKDQIDIPNNEQTSFSVSPLSQDSTSQDISPSNVNIDLSPQSDLSLTLSTDDYEQNTKLEELIKKLEQSEQNKKMVQQISSDVQEQQIEGNNEIKTKLQKLVESMKQISEQSKNGTIVPTTDVKQPVQNQKVLTDGNVVLTKMPFGEKLPPSLINEQITSNIPRTPNNTPAVPTLPGVQQVPVIPMEQVKSQPSIAKQQTTGPVTGPITGQIQSQQTCPFQPPVTKTCSIEINVCPPKPKKIENEFCVFPVSLSDKIKALQNDEKLFEQFSDHQLNLIGMDRNIPDIVIYPRQKKIQLLLSDPNRLEKSSDQPLGNLEIGDLLYIGAQENIAVGRIPDRYNTKRILTSLIMYQRKRSDLVSTILLTDDDLRTIVNVIQAQTTVKKCDKNPLLVNPKQIQSEIPYSWILNRKQLENIYYTGLFPELSEDFISRWRRYETLSILPRYFLQSIAFQLDANELSMAPTEVYLIAKILNIPENPFETIYARDRKLDPCLLKSKYGILVPPTWETIDYIGLNGKDFPIPNHLETNKFLIEKLLSMTSEECRRGYLEMYTDIELFREIKNYISYNGREEMIQNILKLFDEREKVYFISLLPQFEGKVFYGNYSESEVYDLNSLSKAIDFFTVQKYPVEDKIEILRKMRSLQTLLLSRGMMTPALALSLSRLISTYEGTPDAQPILYKFLILETNQIALIRKHFYQRFYFSQTRNNLFLPIVESQFVRELPKLLNVNIPNPFNQFIDKPEILKMVELICPSSFDDLYQVIAYMRLFFGYVPHSIKNL